MSDRLPPSESSLPESLRAQLTEFRRHLWRIKVMEAMAAGLIGLFVSFLLVYGLDRVWPTPGWVRLLVLLAGVSLFAGFAPYWLHRWVWRQRREAQLARLIAKRFPGLGDRLLGVIELEHQKDSPEALSPRLREAAMAAVAAETGRRRLNEALPAPKHLRWGLAAMVFAAGAAAVFVITPRAGFNALQRWLMPLSATERYTFTRLDGAPTKLQVPFGESFVVELRLASDSEQRPSRATGRFALQPQVETALDGGIYRFRFPGQQDPGTIEFRVGDLRHAVAVEPVLRPSIESLAARVTPPDYLGTEADTIDLNHGVLSVVEGGRFTVQLGATRSLREATFGPARLVGETEADAPDDAKRVSPPDVSAMAGPLTIDGPLAKTPEIQLPKGAFELPFSWTDTIGLTGEAGFRLQVEVRPDAAPTCYLQGIDRQRAMLPEETVDFEVLAEDDLSLRDVGLEWTGEFTRPTDETPAKGELKLGGGGKDVRRLLLPASFSPGAFGIQPQKLTVRGYVEDALPGRGRVYSEPIMLYVLTRDEHAQLLKSRFDRHIAEFEDLFRRELGLLEENERLDQLKGDELQNEENRKKLEGQEMEESESARRMEDLKKQMEQLLQDATRNGDIDKKTLQKMAEALKSMQELSDKDVPDVRDKLGEAGDPSNTPEQTDKDMQEAVEQQRDAIKKMQEAIEKATDANRRFEAGTFANRLKKAAKEQDGIVSSVKSAFERMLGIRQKVLDPADHRKLDENIRQQSETASDVRWIQEDLASYHARTKDEKFKTLLDQMMSSRIDIGLDKVRTLLSANHTYKAAEQSKAWADKLREWAKMLEGEEDGAGDGGGDGGGPSPEDEDFEFMLRVMRMIQKEQDLRGRTRVLEQMRRDAQAQSP